MKDPIYDQWMAGNYSNPGGFELSLMQTYQRASSTNRDKLKQVYPEYFGAPELEEVRFLKAALQESEYVQSMAQVRLDSLSQENYREELKSILIDGLNPIDAYIRYVGDHPSREKIFFELITELLTK